MGVGVIGAGNWGRNLVRAFSRLGELSCVAEANEALRESLRREYPGVAFYQDASEAIASDAPAVAIATPAVTHYELTKKALLAGKDVFIEKPFTLSLAQAEELVSLAAEKGRLLMVGHLLLYQPAIKWIKEYIESGALGDVAFLCQERLKLGRVRFVENVLWSFGVHDLAVLLYLIGEEPQEVTARGQCFLQPKIEDDVYLHLKFSSGVMAHLHVSWLWPEQRRCLTIVGSKGMLTYDELTGKVVLHRKWVNETLEACDEGVEVVFERGEEPLLLECRHFLECLEKREEPLSSGKSALKVMAVLEKADGALKGTRA
ncbi:MAG: Gfo/Idh/MocA family protein [Thermacetogeniaceae bacterium]